MPVIAYRRICWPNPDAACLNGSCNQCNKHPFRKLKDIEEWAKAAPPVNQRYKKTPVSAWQAYMQGVGGAFHIAETK